MKTDFNKMKQNGTDAPVVKGLFQGVGFLCLLGYFRTGCKHNTQFFYLQILTVFFRKKYRNLCSKFTTAIDFK